MLLKCIILTLTLSISSHFLLAEKQFWNIIKDRLLVDNKTTITCINALCNRYYGNQKSKIGALLQFHLQNATRFHDRLVASFMHQQEFAIDLVNQFGCRSECYQMSEKTMNYFVAFKDTSEVVGAIDLWSSLPTFNPMAQIVAVFIGTRSNIRLRLEINYVLRLFYEKNMYNVNVISRKTESRIVQVHTWYPYDSGRCADKLPNAVLVEECDCDTPECSEPQFKSINELKPKIPRTLHQCELNVAVSIYEPYTFYDWKSKSFTDGSEILMTKMIAKKLDMKLNFIKINGTRDNRYVSNESGLYSLIMLG